MPTNNLTPADLAALAGRLEENAENRYNMLSDDQLLLAARCVRAFDAIQRYYYGYMQDEAEDVRACVCGILQHRSAAAVRDAIAAVEEAKP